MENKAATMDISSWKKPAVTLAIVAAVFFAVSFCYVGTRHLIVPNNEIDVMGRTLDPGWTTTTPPPRDCGLVKRPRFITNARVTTLEDEPRPATGHSTVVVDWNGVAFLQLNSHDVHKIATKLVSRRIVNRWGQTVLRWHCSADGAITTDGSEFYVMLSVTGGGDSGYTVIFDGERVGKREFWLTITERLWSDAARKCRLHFRVELDGTITQIEDDVQEYEHGG